MSDIEDPLSPTKVESESKPETPEDFEIRKTSYGNTTLRSIELPENDHFLNRIDISYDAGKDQTLTRLSFEGKNGEELFQNGLDQEICHEAANVVTWLNTEEDPGVIGYTADNETIIYYTYEQTDPMEILVGLKVSGNLTDTQYEAAKELANEINEIKAPAPDPTLTPVPDLKMP